MSGWSVQHAKEAQTRAAARPALAFGLSTVSHSANRVKRRADAPPMPRRDPEQVADNDAEPPPVPTSGRARAVGGRERPREKAQRVGEVGRRDGDDAEEREADGGVEAGPEVDELREGARSEEAWSNG